MMRPLFVICLLTNEIKHDFLFRLNIFKKIISLAPMSEERLRYNEKDIPAK